MSTAFSYILSYGGMATVGLLAAAGCAVALGVSRSFAQRFGKAHIPDSPYMTCRSDKIHTARQWAEKVNQTLANMNRRSRLLPLEKFVSLFSNNTSPNRNKK